MDAAISVSISGGNHSASGAKLKADAISVIECATVNAVTTKTRGRNRRNGITRHSRNKQMVGSIQDVEESHLDKPPRSLIPARIERNQSRIAAELVCPNRSIRRYEPQHRDHSRGKPFKPRPDRERGPIGLNRVLKQHIENTWFQTTFASFGSFGPVTCATRFVERGEASGRIRARSVLLPRGVSAADDLFHRSRSGQRSEQ